MILKPQLGSLPVRGHHFTKGLFCHWLMNEGGGNTLYDVSGNNNVGAFVGDVSWVSGKFGPTLNFPGSTDYVSIINAKTYTKLTISVWINGSYFDASGTHMVISGLSSQTYIVVNNRALGCVIKSTFHNSGVTLSTNTWYHVVCTYDGVRVKIYLDGNEILDAAETTDPPANQKFYVGTYGSSPSSFEFYGMIDNLMIFDIALTATEIIELYRNPFCMFERDPIELWVAATSVGVPPVGIARPKVFGSLANGSSLIGRLAS